MSEILPPLDDLVILPGNPYTPGDSDEVLVGNIPAPAVVPTADGAGDEPITYPDYNSSNSFVVSGPLGEANFPGRRFTRPDDARKYLSQRYGRVYEFGYLPGRWFGRVPRPANIQSAVGV